MFFIYSNNVNADVADKLLILQKLTTFKISQQKQPASLNISMEALHLNTYKYGLCCHSRLADTTTSNTGRKSAACTLFHDFSEQSLLHLACRHHIHKLMLKVAFVEIQLKLKLKLSSR